MDDIIVIENHLIGILNSMNLDASTYKVHKILIVLLSYHLFILKQEAYDNAWENLNKLKEEKERTAQPVILMKHIPLHKEDFNFSGTHFTNLYTHQRKMELCAERAGGSYD